MAYSGSATGNIGTPLGKEFGVPILTASGKHISMEDCEGILFCTFEAAGTQSIAFKESIAGASEQVLPIFTEFFTGNGAGGVVGRETQAADDAWSKSDTTPGKDALYISVRRDMLSPGFDSVELTIDGAGQCIAIPFGLKVQRAPQNLPATAV